MSATGKTPNFQIPIYNAGDTANYLTSYNNAMSIIDGQMQANKSAAAVAQSAVETLETTVSNQAEEISEVKEVANSSAITWYPMTVQSENVSEMNFNNFGANVEVTFIRGNFNINKLRSAITNTVTNGSEIWMPLAFVTGNPVGLQEGIANRQILANCCLTNATPNAGTSALRMVDGGLWLIGGNTYIGVLISNIVSDTTIANIGMNCFAVNE